MPRIAPPKVFKMCLFGHPCLREKAEPVDVKDPELAEFCARLVETMRYENGIGLAAPQIGYSKRIFVIEIPEVGEEEEEVRTLTPGEQFFGSQPAALLNPQLTDFSTQETDFVEGCLSIPELTGTVNRPEFVSLTATLADGRTVNNLRCGGLLARCLQHEYDHLEGVLFVDLISDEDLAGLKPDLKRMERKTAAQLRRNKKRRR